MSGCQLACIRLFIYIRYFEESNFSCIDCSVSDPVRQNRVEKSERRFGQRAGIIRSMWRRFHDQWNFVPWCAKGGHFTQVKLENTYICDHFDRACILCRWWRIRWIYIPAGHDIDFTTREDFMPWSAKSGPFTQVRLKKHNSVSTSIGLASLSRW